MNNSDPGTRLSAFEDQFTERKLEGAGSQEFRKTIVAFANTLPPGRTGILFVGVTDSGGMEGVSNPDKLQRTLRTIAENDCYPPIPIDIEVLDRSEGHIVAVTVHYSTRRPHFAGPAFIRRGSESVNATEEVYRALLLSQNEKRRHLLDFMDATWTLEFINKYPGEIMQLHDAYAHSSSECRVVEVTAFYARFKDMSSGVMFTEMLQDIHITYDDKRHRPRAGIWPVSR